MIIKRLNNLRINRIENPHNGLKFDRQHLPFKYQILSPESKVLATLYTETGAIRFCQGVTDYLKEKGK